MAERKKYKFALVTYIKDTGEVLSLLMKHQNSIRAFALIKHDKDEADVHHHIVIRTHSNWTCPRVARWFEGNSEGQNTFAQFVIDDMGIIEYLTHENEEDGFHYDKADIIDGGLSDLIPKEDQKDESADIVADMVEGVSIRVMVKRYGRDFIYHYQQYLLISEAIKQEIHEENLKNPVSASPNYTKL